MDVNNLQDRIDVLYHATNDFIERVPFADVEVKRTESDEAGRFTITFGGGDLSPKERIQATHTFSDIFSRLANLKDAIKNSVVSFGLSGQMVEQHVNARTVLCIVMDINNTEKHGYPLRNSRSCRDPKIQNVRKELAVPLVPGRFSNLLTDGVVGLEADVTDNNGAFIMNVRNLIESAISSWEDFCLLHLPNQSTHILAKREFIDRRAAWEADMAVKRTEVVSLVEDEMAWCPIPVEQLHHFMFLRAKDKSSHQTLAMGKMTKTQEQITDRTIVPVFDVELGENRNMSKIDYDWEVLTTQTEAQLGLINEYFWDLFHPPSFEE